MGKKKKKLAKPWCWYCDREFEDEKILINHQKAKHFKCYQCHKKLTTATGLAIHLYSVHKETITTVPNAKEGRNTLKPDIIGMDGVPEDAVRGAAAAGSDDEDGTKRARVDPSQPIPKAYVPPPSNVLPTLSQLGPPPPTSAPYPKPGGVPPAPLLSSAGPGPAPGVAPMHPPPMGGPQGLPPQAMPPYPPPHMRPAFPGGHPPPYGYPPPPYGFMPGPPGHGMPPLNPALSGFAPPPMYNQPPPMHAPGAPPAFAAYANPAAGTAAVQSPRKPEEFIPVNAPAAAVPAAVTPSAAPAAAGAVLMVYDDEFQSPEERRASLRRYSFEPR